MKRCFVILTLALCIAAFMNVQPAAAAQYTISFAHNLPPKDTSQYHVWFVKFKEYVERFSKGAIEMKEFPASQMGDDVVAAKKLQMNAIQMQIVAANNLASFYSGFDLFTLPFIAKSLECGIINVLRDEELRKDVSREAEAKANIRVLAWSSSGMRNMMNSKHPIQKPDDLKGLRFRVAKNPILLDLYAALGGNAIGIASAETFSALQTKVVDGNDGSIGWAHGLKFYEVQKYYSITNHQMVTMALIINNKFYLGLPENIRKAIDQAAIISTSLIDSWIMEKESVLIDDLAKRGMEVIYPDLEPFRSVAKSVWEKYADRVGGMKRIERVVELQKDCF